MNELEDFYSALFNSEGNLADCANLFLQHSEIPKLSPGKTATREGKSTVAVEDCVSSKSSVLSRKQITRQWRTYCRIY